jgi:hypothetical protein
VDLVQGERDGRQLVGFDEGFDLFHGWRGLEVLLAEESANQR